MSEVIIETKACLQIAQSVYNEYLKAMEPPLYIFMTFPEWLTKGLEQLDNQEDKQPPCINCGQTEGEVYQGQPHDHVCPDCGREIPYNPEEGRCYKS